MIVFQYVTIAILAVLLLADIVRCWRGHHRRRWCILRGLVWLTAALAIAFPAITTRAAMIAGISRGADLVMYSFVLGFIIASFYFYSRCERLERQITELVRQQALAEARIGATGPHNAENETGSLAASNRPATRSDEEMEES